MESQERRAMNKITKTFQSGWQIEMLKVHAIYVSNIIVIDMLYIVNF